MTGGVTSHLDELAALRRELQQFSRLRERSIREFYDVDKGWFRLTVDPPSHSGKPTKTVEHLTTTLTCLESLAEAPASDKDLLAYDEFKPSDPAEQLTTDQHADDSTTPMRWRRVVLRSYADAAFKNPQDWKSDGAAFVYCRVRTLGAIGRLLDPEDVVMKSNGETAGRLLEQAWSSHEPAPTYGLRESTDDPELGDLTALMGSDAREAYVPNAFLTYWGLLALDKMPEGLRPCDWQVRQQAALEWLQKSLAQQVSFHYTGSGNADPQQLAWSLCAHVRYSPINEITAKTTVAHTQLAAALKAFFEQQLPSGDWPKGQPLFFYPHAGNAYCYTYETVAELLSLATLRDRRYVALREALLPYVKPLRDLYRLADHTRQSLPGDDTYGWSSGHNPRRVTPEAWATASVYRFVEAFRRLVGVWTNLEAQHLLEARRPEAGLDELRTRGGTWNVGRGSAGTQLAAGFLNPIRRQEAIRLARTDRELDPDLPVVPKSGATSAILFGPPGTGKTTLVEAVAGALDWPFVEITPAQFLDRGVELVSARADAIFRQVMELNRCVVLLDEIDELTRTRSDEAEPVERFFTTTMLPRLAKLWKTKRILFFVNTNNILRVDPAIRRSQRFDAAIFVLPPGFEAKRAHLQRHDPPVQIEGITEAEVTSHLRREPVEKGLPEARRLAWLALLRYDQLDRFADDLIASSGGSAAAPNVAHVLPPFIEELLSLDWHGDDNKPAPPADEPPADLERLLAAQRRDPAMRLLVAVDQSVAAVPDGARRIGDFVEVPPREDDADGWALRLGLRLRPDGVLEAPTS